MVQPVKVESRKGNDIFVSYPNPKGDKATASRSFWNVKEKAFPVDNPKNLDFDEGDMVKIFVEPSGAIKAAFMVFIFPLLCFLALYLLADTFSDNSVVLYLSGVLGLVGGFVANILIHKKRGAGSLPYVESVMTPVDIDFFKSCHSACKDCKGCG